MKKLFTIFWYLILSHVLYSQIGWYQLPCSQTLSLNGIYFTDQNTGYITRDDGTVLKTTNNGNDCFNSLLITGYSYEPEKICFPSIDFGFFSTWQGYIIRTTNAGGNWSSYHLSSEHLSTLYFPSLNTGYAAGFDGTTNGIIFKTTDVGNSWFTTSTQYSQVLESIYFLDANTGFVSGAYNNGWGSIILKTTNGGVNWNQTTFYPDVYDITDIYFMNSNTGFAVGNYNGGGSWVIYETVNGGLNWNFLQYSNGGGQLRRIRFWNDNVGITVGYAGHILQTTNGGTNWINYGSPVSNNLYDIYFTNNYGFIVGMNGTILKGNLLNGIRNVNNKIPNRFQLYLNYPNPFNPTTKINFDISKSSFTKLIIYDILDREVMTLVNEELKPGSYEYEWNGSGFASGVYFYKLTTGDASSPLSITKKMVLLK
jgi:photosystem II stability/assembly factor-like uncharacterized protein